MAGKKVNLTTCDSPLKLDSNERDQIVINIIVKSVGKTDKEIIQAAYKSNYMLMGNIATLFEIPITFDVKQKNG
jgi:hypothetical protein